MPAFSLDDVIHALQRCAVLEQVKTQFTDIVTDTRKIVPGALFVALKGERFNGEDFAAQAVEQGAAGVLVGTFKQLIEDLMQKPVEELKELYNNREIEK